MAHARMSGIFRNAAAEGHDVDRLLAGPVDYGLLAEPAEQELITKLVDFPRVVGHAAESLEPHRVAAYLLELANLVHAWYHKHHVLGEEPALTTARLALARAARTVLRNALAVLGISAPDRM
jgi:arginyl-tRNA synthetase